MDRLPEGTVTFLLTDVEGSTYRWETHPKEMRAAMEGHDRLVTASLRRSGGVMVESGREGDSVLVAFSRAPQAAACALELQRAFAAEPWPPEVGLSIRIALHTGEAEVRKGHYFGQALNRCARLLAAAHGGQTLLTLATEQLLAHQLPEGAELRDLGRHRFRDLMRAEHVFELVDRERSLEFPPIHSLDRRLTNLPVQLTSFVGRDEELKHLAGLLPATRLLTLTGPGGCGKTRLAVHLAADLMGRYPDGAWFADLSALSDPTLVPRAVAAALDIEEQRGREITDTLLDHCRDKQLLLVLDNCEHVITGAAGLAVALLRAARGVTIVATSREPLRVPGERSLPVPPLRQEEAVRLFADRAAAVSVFSLGNRNYALVAELCDRLDGIPLAVELAAARAPVMSPADILRRLESRFSLLIGGSRTAAARQQTLQATLDWSYELLDAHEKVLFRRLAVFAARFTLEAAEQVCSDGELSAEQVLDPISSLVAKSLVLAEEGGFRCLETVRAYARLRLQAAHESAAMQSRVARYLLQLAEAREPGRLADWLNRMDGLLPDLRATLRWSAGEDPDAGVRLLLATHLFWSQRGYIAEARQASELLQERAAPQLRPGALWLAGYFAYTQADFDQAEERLRAAVAGARRSRDQFILVRSLDTLGLLLASARADPAGAQTALDEGLALARQIGAPELEANLLHELGVLAGLQGEASGAALIERSIELRTSLGRRDETGISLTFLGNFAAFGGDLARAKRCLLESLEIARLLGDRRASWSLEALAGVAAAEGMPERALTLAGAGAALHQATGAQPPAPWRQLIERLLEPAYEALGDEAEAVVAAGRRLHFEAALEYALERAPVQT